MGEDAETKKIARLDFDVKNAINNLDIIDKKLKSIAESSNLYAKQIGKNIGSSFDFSKVLNVDSFSQQLSKVTNLSEAQAKRLVTNMMKNEQNVTAKTKIEQEKRQTAIVQSNAKQLQSEARTADKIKEISAEIEAYKEKKAYATVLKQEEYNNRVAKSTESLYDKISKYASTYLIYQGFNMLKQAAAETIEEMVNVEYQMIAIDRVLSESSLDIDHYRDKLMKLAYDYGNSFNNVADITLRLAQAGFNSQESIALTEKTLLALNTAELDATQATDDMVAVMAQWGLMTGTATEKAKSYGDIIDKINKVADNFPTTSSDIMDALKKVSSAFNLAGADIDETIATIVAAEKASQRGGKVIGTALSNITQQLKAEKKLDLAEQLGLNFFKDAKKTEFKPIMEIFQEMADRMEQLKSQGKESSTEMQQLLELFTVFRRNIGASLLGEMAGGEESTYMQVYKTSIESVGYSLQENEKYMKSAKAAQEQFNTTLLQLKTAVWDNGLEDVFRSMLMLGNDVTKTIKFLIDTFGSIPTAIGVATMAMTAFNKQLKVQVSYKAGEGFGINNEFLNKIKQADKDVKALTSDVLQLGNAKVKANATLTQYIEKVGIANVSTKGYISYLVKQKAATIAAEAATLALNTALSLGLSAGITLIISGIDKLIHAEENAAKKAQERVNTAKDLFDSYEKERNSLNELIKGYDELAKKSSRTPEDELKIYEIQTQINSLIKDQKQSIDLVNGAYDETIKKLKQISDEERGRSLKSAELAMKETEKQTEDYGNFGLEEFRPGFEMYKIDLGQIQNQIMPGTVFQKSVDEILKAADYETTIRLLEEFKQKLEDAGDTSSDMYYKIIEDLKTMYGLQNNVNEATDTYNNILAESKIAEMFSEDSIKNVEDYKKALDSIGSSNFSDELKDKMELLLAKTFPDFAKTVKESANGIEVTKEQLKELNEASNESIDSLVNLETGFNSVYSAMDEFNKQGYISASTLQNLIKNDLLQFFDVVNGKLSINEAAMANAATAAKAKAIEDLQAKAAAEIAAVAFNTESSAASGAASTTSNMTTKANNVKNALITLTPKILENANAWVQLNKSMGGTLEGLGDDQKKQINDIMNNLGKSIRTINSIKITGVSYTRTSARSSGGSSRGSSSSSTSKAEEKKKKEYEKRLKYFTNTIEKMETKEEEWVNKQKELGLLSNSDMVYVTKRRIKEYEKYLDKIKNATWMNKEDRKKMQDEYNKKLKEAQLDYFKYLKEKLDDEVKAIEDARDKKIKALEEENDKKIELLKKQREAERDTNERQGILDDIAYWKQRTGKEAIENLAEARKKLAEFDRDAQIEAQIEAIEENEKRQKASIERQAQTQIDALKKVYDKNVKAFSESNKIIYDNSVISAKNLYNAYKKNFVDPLNQQLKFINKKNVNYTVKKGDTLESIAKEIAKSTKEKTSTIIKRIKSANSSLKNTKNTTKLKKGLKIKIPMYHKGGIFDGTEEGLALLKKGEWVLRPEWSNSLNRMMKYFDNMTQRNINPINNNSKIEVSGNLVNIQANVRNQSDIDAIGQKVEKILRDKFNIKK